MELERPRRRRHSLGGLMGLVALCAIGFAALRAETVPTRALLLLAFLCGMLLALRAIV